MHFDKLGHKAAFKRSGLCVPTKTSCIKLQNANKTAKYYAASFLFNFFTAAPSCDNKSKTFAVSSSKLSPS